MQAYTCSILYKHISLMIYPNLQLHTCYSPINSELIPATLFSELDKVRQLCKVCWYEDILYMARGQYVRTATQCPHQCDRNRGEKTWLTERPVIRLRPARVTRGAEKAESATRGWKSKSITMLPNVDRLRKSFPGQQEI